MRVRGAAALGPRWSLLASSAPRRDARARVLLHTTDRMLAAQRLYERLGFTRTPGDDFEVEPAFWLRAYRYELA